MKSSQDERILSDRFRCSLCVEQGWPDDFGSEPQCAFTENGKFTADNWACATAMKLRSLATGEDWEREQHSGDQKIATLPFFDGMFLVIGWYKNRGTTEFVAVLDETRILEMTLKTAEEILEEIPK
jgi:hypothetical protein